MDGKEITDALSNVKDSYFNKDLITLGYIKGMSIGDKELRFTLKLPAPLMPNHEELAQKCREALKDVEGLETIEIKKDWEVQRLPSLDAPNTPQALRNVKNIIAIASGKGGVGKSTVASNIACGLKKKGLSVGPLDLDIYGPSLPIILGLNQKPDMTEKNRLIPLDRYGMKVMSFGFISGNQSPTIWRGPLVARMTEQFFYDVVWGELDYLISVSYTHLTLPTSDLV